MYLIRFSLLSARNNEGKTSVHIAAQNGHTQLLELLVQHGGDPLSADRQGRSAVDWASLEHHQPTVRFLNDLLSTSDDKNTSCDPKFTFTFSKSINCIHGITLDIYLPRVMGSGKLWYLLICATCDTKFDLIH